MFDTNNYSIFYQNSQETGKGYGDFHQNSILSGISPHSIRQQLKSYLETRHLTKVREFLEKPEIKRKSTVIHSAKLTSEIEVAA